MNPYVFIVGCARSGTTLLRRMVDAHPEIAILRAESHWIPGYYAERVGMTPDGTVTPRLVSALLEHPKFVKLRIDRAELESLLGNGRSLSYSAFVTALFDLYARKQGKSLAGDKTPRYVRDIETLHGLWPSARFVHLIRDGRDVSLSVRDWHRKAPNFARLFGTWGDNPVSTAALWWGWHVALGREGGSALGHQLYYEVRYEALVEDAERECRKLCAFLGVRYDDAMLRFHEGRTKNKPGLSAKRAWLPVTAGLRDWRTQMAPDDVERVEAAVGDLLDELGYSRGAPRLRRKCIEGAAAVRRAFSADVLAQGWRLPEQWL